MTVHHVYIPHGVCLYTLQFFPPLSISARVRLVVLVPHACPDRRMGPFACSCRSDTVPTLISMASILRSQMFLCPRLCAGNQASVICRFANHSLCVYPQTLRTFGKFSPSDFICGSLIVYYLAAASDGGIMINRGMAVYTERGGCSTLPPTIGPEGVNM